LFKPFEQASIERYRGFDESKWLEITRFKNSRWKFCTSNYKGLSSISFQSNLARTDCEQPFHWWYACIPKPKCSWLSHANRTDGRPQVITVLISFYINPFRNSPSRQQTT